MKGAIFFDRDGVIVKNSEHYYIWNAEQLVLVDGVLENLRMLSKKGYQLFIVSNQGGISRGLYSKAEVESLHKVLMGIFIENDVEITEIAFCPHHNEIEKCLCRKPESLMIEKLIAKYKLVKEDCFLIGDSSSDMEAAQKAGINGVQISSNQNMNSCLSVFENE